MKQVVSYEAVSSDIARAVALRDSEKLDSLVITAKNADMPKHDAMAALTRGIEVARGEFSANRLAIPEFLICLDLMNEAMDAFSDLPDSGPSLINRPRMVIGVAEGDVHDLGKNVVAAVCRAYGFEVTDLGRDVTPAVFINAVKKTEAHVLAVSAMMSTPLNAMRETVALCRRECPETLVFVGGAAVDEKLALGMGANATAVNAALLPGVFSKLRLLPSP
ncbi:MAG: cobalamin B12-binding domain-containing protein [Deltaproteobacteria bacterium]|nr:cobalamin B12-binding domain-containing protein [Deltaproteobacteria bacterium]